ncbi:extra-cytoplasmic solute receptor [Natrialba chahannaoensis JCM 10990]|uniref:Extra-cytoplasmic solute receptor n=1 Tax=Natrialba chahannaoensis JCM 10990 TaxID=1227492 RepID=M0B5S3_9EURY|nr:tripartite tricarboxylate transporter substrate-binding protein [Natrialba chahannaoensis]ELZ05603.1 extra-cytoplasmic solute receptor [Natrialba chahannaoensis JCM 10990]
MNRRRLLKGIGAASTVSLAGLAGCLDNEELTWMIPWSEGGGTDTYARQLGPLMEEELDGSVVIDNQPGAGSLRGIEWLHSQADDGTVFGTANTPSWQFGWRLEGIDDWHPSDFEPIAYSGVFGYTIIVNDELGVSDFSELQDAYADGEVDNFAYQGVGHDSHVISYLLRDEYDLEWENAVAYDGGGEVNEAVISGETPVGIATNTSAADAADSGDVSAIVNLMDTDIDAFPEIDQITNYGDSLAYITEFRQTQIAPPGTPEDVRQDLADAIEYAATHDEAQEWAEETGNVLEYGDIDAAADDLGGALDDLEENVDFEAFQERIEEDA